MIPSQARGHNIPQLTGVYIQNRRAIDVNGFIYPLPIEASMYVMTWENGKEVKGEVSNNVFYPHVKLC